MNRNQKLEEFLQLEAEIIEIQDGITGMTSEVDAFIKQKEIEIKAIYDAGNLKLDELDKQKQAIIEEPMRNPNSEHLRFQKNPYHSKSFPWCLPEL